MLVSCIQQKIKTCDPEDNSRRALDLAATALESGSEILVFPELFLTGFCYDQPPDSPPYSSLDSFRRLAVEWGCLIIGSIMSRASSRPGGMYNLGFCIGEDFFGTYAKAHPFGPEKEHFSGGEEISPVATSKGKIGLEICYDLRFPEVARALTLKGADLLVTIAEFPVERISHWRTLCVARAVENLIHHVACNGVSQKLGGCSMIVDPWGRVVAFAGTRETVISGEVDFDLRDSAREALPCLAERRPEIYEI
jgi:predicted amidohydrolase